MIFGSALPNPIALSVGAFGIRWYALIIVSAIVAGFSITRRMARQQGIQDETVWDILLFTIPAAIIFGRLAFVLSHLPLYYTFKDTLKIWEGGISSHGTILGGLLVIVLIAWKRRISFWMLMDIIVPGAVLAQAIGRWGNYMNQEAFGPPTNLPWAVPIQPSLRPDRYANFDYFHPTWLYESIWNLVVFVVLLLLFKRVRHKPGVLAAIYFLLYYAGRFVLEFFRLDTVFVGAVRFTTYLSIAVMIVAVSVLIARMRRAPQTFEDIETIQTNKQGTA